MHMALGGCFLKCTAGEEAALAAGRETGRDSCAISFLSSLVFLQKPWGSTGRFAFIAHTSCGDVYVCLEEGDLIDNICVPKAAEKSFWMHTHGAGKRESVGSVASVLFPLG